MIAIVIGYTAPGSQAEFEVLYAGRDASAADQLSLAPPAGILRTELFKNPQVVRRRSFPDNLLPAADLQLLPESDATKETKKKS